MARAKNQKPKKVGSRKADPKKPARDPETRVVRAATAEAASRALEGHELVDADVDSTGAAVLLLRKAPKRSTKLAQAARFSTAEKANVEEFESILDAAFMLRVGGGREITWVFYWQDVAEDEAAQEGEKDDEHRTR